MEMNDKLEKEFKNIEAITDVLISSDCRNFQKDTVPVMAESINKSLAVIKEILEKVASLQPF